MSYKTRAYLSRFALGLGLMILVTLAHEILYAVDPTQAAEIFIVTKVGIYCFLFYAVYGPLFSALAHIRGALADVARQVAARRGWA